MNTFTLMFKEHTRHLFIYRHDINKKFLFSTCSDVISKYALCTPYWLGYMSVVSVFQTPRREGGGAWVRDFMQENGCLACDLSLFSILERKIARNSYTGG